MLPQPAAIGTQGAALQASIRWSLKEWLWRTLVVALMYFIVAYSNAELMRQKDLSAPIALAAGVALGLVLCWGRRAALGVYIGCFAVVWLMSTKNNSASMLGSASIAAGATLQALLGNWLVRRFAARTLLLMSQLREILLFFALAGAVSTLIYPAVMLATFVFVYGFPYANQSLGIWLGLWVAQFGGIVIGTPLVLTLMARPREVWAPRRMSVALPLLIAALLLLVAAGAMSRWEKQRTFASLDREAEVAAKAIEGALHESLAALAATRGLLTVEPDIGRVAFASATQYFFPEGGRIDYVGQAKLVARDPAALAAFNAQARADGIEGFTARDSQQGVDSPAPAGEALMVIRNVEPPGRIVGEAGLNIRSARAGREALELARLSGGPISTEGFLQDNDHGDLGKLHVAVLQALYKDGVRGSAMTGAAFVVLKPGEIVRSVTAQISGRIKPCLMDDDLQAVYRRLAGEPGCDSPSLTQSQLTRKIRFAGRSWSLRLYPAVVTSVHPTAESMVFSLLSVLSISLLGTLLLSFSGRAQSIEALVGQRTAELQQASQALRLNEQRFRGVFDKAPVGVFISSLDGVPLEANPQFCRMLACPAAELAEFYRPYTGEDERRARELAQGRETVQIRRTYRSRDGRELQALLLMSLLPDANGKAEHLLCVVQDLTDQLKLVEHERAREAAEASNRTKSEFLSHMSHELRTPLNGLLGFTQLLQLDGERSLSTQQRDWIAKIGQAGWHLLAMINDVLDLSRIETGNLKVTLERQDVLVLVDEVKALLAPAALQRGIKVRTRLLAMGRHAIGDLTRMREILGNLLSNAIKYNTTGGEVLISVQLVGVSYIDIAVTDTGPGLSSAQLASLFEPFNRLGQERGSIEGTGIGLVISRRLAELMNGSLRMGSQLGKGTTFTLRLPAADGDAPPMRAAVSPVFAGTAWRQRQRLAYIEDNTVNIEVMRAVIAQRPLADLQVYEDGTSGLAAMLAHPPALLLLDMQLPDTDGLSLLRRLREAPQCKDVIVIMVSADALDSQIHQCLEAGARHYMTKPFNIHDLLALLDELLGE